MEKEEVLKKLNGDTFLLYGRAKTGKSTLASKFPDPVFIATEPGLKYINIDEKAKKYVFTWSEFIRTAQTLRDTKHDYQTWIIDTLDELWTLCSEHVCAANNMSHPADKSQGKGWSLCKDEFRRGIMLMHKAPILVMVGHSKIIEMGPKDGKYSFATLNLPGKAKDAVLNFVDNLLYLAPGGKEDNNERIIYTDGTKYFDAGSRNGNLASCTKIKLDFKTLVNSM